MASSSWQKTQHSRLSLQQQQRSRNPAVDSSITDDDGECSQRSGTRLQHASKHGYNAPSRSSSGYEHAASAHDRTPVEGRPNNWLDSSQIAGHLMQIRNWSQQIMSEIEKLDETVNPDCRKLKQNLFTLLDDLKKSENEYSKLLREVLEQREVELLLRQNSMENTFHREDYKSEDDTEIGLSSDGESVNTLDMKPERQQVQRSAYGNRDFESPLNNRRPAIESHLGRHPDSDTEDAAVETLREDAGVSPSGGATAELSHLVNRRSLLENELLKRSKQLTDLREQHALLKEMLEHQQQLQALKEQQMALLLSGEQQDADDWPAAAPSELRNRTAGPGNGKPSGSGVPVQSGRVVQRSCEDEHFHHPSPASRPADNVLTHVRSGAPEAAQGAGVGPARPAVRVDSSAGNSDQVPRDLSNSELDLLNVHKQLLEAQERLRKLDEQQTALMSQRVASSSVSGRQVGNIQSESKSSDVLTSRQRPPVSDGEAADEDDEVLRALSTLSQNDPEMREKMRRLAAASDRLQKLHELIGTVHNVCAARDMQLMHSTSGTIGTQSTNAEARPERSSTSANQAVSVPPPSNKLTLTSSNVGAVGGSQHSAIAEDELDQAEQWDRLGQMHRLQRLETLRSKRDQLLSMEATLQRLIDSMQSLDSMAETSIGGGSGRPPSGVKDGRQERVQHSIRTGDALHVDRNISDAERLGLREGSVPNSERRVPIAVHRSLLDVPSANSSAHRSDNLRSADNSGWSNVRQPVHDGNHDNRSIQNNQRQSSREEPRRLTDRPINGDGGVHLLRNATATAKNARSRRSSDMTPLAEFHNEIQALRNEVLSLTAVVQSRKTDRVPTDPTVTSRQQHLLVELERSFNELLVANSDLCQRMARLEQLVYANRPSYTPSLRSFRSNTDTAIRDALLPRSGNIPTHSSTGGYRRVPQNHVIGENSVAAVRSRTSEGSAWELAELNYNSADAAAGGSTAHRMHQRSFGERQKTSGWPRDSQFVDRSLARETMTSGKKVKNSAHRWKAVPDERPRSSNGSEMPIDSRRVSSFNALRELIYKEVAALISQNETRPHYLVELFRRLQQLTTDRQRDQVVASFKHLVSDYLTEHDLRLKMGLENTSTQSHPTDTTAAWHSSTAWQREGTDDGGSVTDHEVSRNFESNISQSLGLLIGINGDDLYSPDPDHDNEPSSKSTEPEEVEEQLEASTDNDADAMAEKMGFVTVNFAHARSPPSFSNSGDSWEKSVDEEVPENIPQRSDSDDVTVVNNGQRADGQSPSPVRTEVVESLIHAFSPSDIAERMAAEFQGDLTVQHVLNNSWGIDGTELAGRPDELRFPDDTSRALPLEQGRMQ